MFSWIFTFLGIPAGQDIDGESDENVPEWGEPSKFIRSWGGQVGSSRPWDGNILSSYSPISSIGLGGVDRRTQSFTNYQPWGGAAAYTRPWRQPFRHSNGKMQVHHWKKYLPSQSFSHRKVSQLLPHLTQSLTLRSCQPILTLRWDIRCNYCSYLSLHTSPQLHTSHTSPHSHTSSSSYTFHLRAGSLTTSHMEECRALPGLGIILHYQGGGTVSIPAVTVGWNLKQSRN